MIIHPEVESCTADRGVRSRGDAAKIENTVEPPEAQVNWAPESPSIAMPRCSEYHLRSASAGGRDKHAAYASHPVRGGNHLALLTTRRDTCDRRHQRGGAIVGHLDRRATHSSPRRYEREFGCCLARRCDARDRLRELDDAAVRSRERAVDDDSDARCRVQRCLVGMRRGTGANRGLMLIEVT